MVRCQTLPDAAVTVAVAVRPSAVEQKQIFYLAISQVSPVTAPIMSSAFRSLWSTSGEPKSSQPQIGPYRQFSSSLARGPEKAVYRSLGSKPARHFSSS